MELLFCSFVYFFFNMMGKSILKEVEYLSYEEQHGQTCKPQKPLVYISLLMKAIEYLVTTTQNERQFWQQRKMRLGQAADMKYFLHWLHAKQQGTLGEFWVQMNSQVNSFYLGNKVTTQEEQTSFSTGKVGAFVLSLTKNDACFAETK